MDLEEFRKRVKSDLKPMYAVTIEDRIAREKELFMSCKAAHALRGQCHVAMALNSTHAIDVAVFQWITKTHKAYRCTCAYKNGVRSGQGHIKEWSESQFQDHENLQWVVFAPIGATKEEIELSTNSVFK